MVWWERGELPASSCASVLFEYFLKAHMLLLEFKLVKSFFGLQLSVE